LYRSLGLAGNIIAMTGLPEALLSAILLRVESATTGRCVMGLQFLATNWYRLLTFRGDRLSSFPVENPLQDLPDI
jgi:hypothetical protein